MVSNTPASVSIWKYKKANKSIKPADCIMEESCSTTKVLVSSTLYPKSKAQTMGTMRSTKLKGTFFVITVATTIRIRTIAINKTVFISAAPPLYLLICFRINPSTISIFFSVQNATSPWEAFSTR